MLFRIDARKAIVFGLLAAHTLWIGNHLRLVYHDRINPWRLGGYGMYTRPNRAVVLQVYDIRFADAPMLIPNTEISLVKFDRAIRLTNSRRAFRCAHPTSTQLGAFFGENKHLIGRKLAFIYNEAHFLHKAPWLERQQQGEVIIDWEDDRNLTYTSTFCGDEAKGTASLP